MVLDAIGSRYGQRPSAVWGLTEPRHIVLATAFDAEVLRRANEFESRHLEEIRSGKPDAGQRGDEQKLQSRLAWARFAETLPDGHPVKERALKLTDEGKA